jgi:MFS family permease
MALPKAFWLLWTGQTLNRIGLLAPAFLVLYLEQGDITDASTTPVIVGLFAFGVLAGGLVGGVVADMAGARRTIILAQPVAVLTALLFIGMADIYLIGLLSLAAGVLSTVDRPAGAGLIAKLVPQEQFARAYSMYLVGFNIGMALGPVLAGFLLAIYPPALFISWLVSSLLYAVLVWPLSVDETKPTGTRGSTTGVRRFASGLVEPFRSPVLLVFLSLTSLLACIYLQLNSALPLDMHDEGMTTSEIGIVLAINAVLSVALLPLVPRIVRGMRDEVPLVMAAALIALGFGMNAFAHEMSAFIVALVVWTLGEVLWAPMSATFLAKRAPEGRTSTYQGAFFFAWNVAFTVGGPVGITVANAFGYDMLWISTFVLGIIVSFGLVLMGRMPGFNAPAAEPAEPAEPSVETTTEAPRPRDSGKWTPAERE